MHVCCAPCFIYIENDIRQNGITNNLQVREKVELTAFWNNPNIHPKVEYERRKDAFIKFCDELNIEYVMQDYYNLKEFATAAIDDVGEDKLYKTRCEYCYKARLEQTFKYAKENNFDIVSTTLEYSPYQNQNLIKKIGNELSEKYKIEFIYNDYTSMFRQGQAMARAHDIYMQKYCGCMFSIDSRKVGVLMKKYNKSELKNKRKIKLILTILILVVILSVSLVIVLTIKNEIVKENVLDLPSVENTDVSNKANPIIVNNLLLGAVYDKTWVNANQFNIANTSTKMEVDMYNNSGKAGKFEITNFRKEASTGGIYVTTTSLNKSDEYFGVKPTDKNIMPKGLTKIDSNEVDLKAVKKALGMYKLLNSTININEVYSVNINNNLQGKIICATSKSKNIFGVYSIILFVDWNGNTNLIKYHYIKNIQDANNWGIYSLKFVADLNSDNSNELIIQETTGLEVKYSIIEYRQNKFVEVLSSSIKI